jgi:hypothetical protein
VSHPALRWALQAIDGVELPPSSALLLIVLADHHNHTYGCFPSQARLCARLRLSERGLRKALKVLVEKNLVSVVSRGRNNRYVLNFAFVCNDDTGTEVPVCNSDTGTVVPVATGTVVPVSVGKSRNTGTGVPVVLTSNKKSKRTSKSEARLASDPCEGSSEEDGAMDEKKAKLDGMVHAMQTAGTVEEAVAEALTVPPGKGHPTPLRMYNLWRKLHSVYLPDHKLTAATAKMMGLFNHCYKAGGDQFILSLPLVVQHWGEFAVVCKSHHDVKHVPPKPDLDFILKHISVVLNFTPQQGKAAPVNPVVATPLPDLTNLLETPQTDLPTKEEILALLNK